MAQFSINLKECFEVADIDYIAVIAATNNILAPNTVERRLFRPHRTFLELSSFLAPLQRLQVCKAIQLHPVQQLNDDGIIGTATRHAPHGPRIVTRMGRDFLHQSTPALEPNQPPVQCVPGPVPRTKAAGAWR